MPTLSQHGTKPFYMLCCFHAIFSHHRLSGRVWAVSVGPEILQGFCCTAAMGASPGIHLILHADKIPFTISVKALK